MVPAPLPVDGHIYIHPLASGDKGTLCIKKKKDYVLTIHLYKHLYIYSILYRVHILYFLYFFCCDHIALGYQLEITVEVYLKVVSAALE